MTTDDQPSSAPETSPEKKKNGDDATPKDAPLFLIWGDKEIDPNVMFIKIDLKSPTEDLTGNAAIYLLGFFEHAKNQAIAMIQAKRLKQRQSTIIKPGNSGHPGLRIVQ